MRNRTYVLIATTLILAFLLVGCLDDQTGTVYGDQSTPPADYARQEVEMRDQLEGVPTVEIGGRR